MQAAGIASNYAGVQVHINIYFYIFQVFFNSMVAAYLGWIDKRNDPTKAVILGDGSPVDDQVLQGSIQYG